LRGAAVNAGAADDAPFTGSAYAATELKSTLNYHAILDSTAKINLALSVFTRGKTDSERLFRLQGSEKLDGAHDFDTRILAPFGEGGENFI